VRNLSEKKTLIARYNLLKFSATEITKEAIFEMSAAELSQLIEFSGDLYK
jgi:hypothetical protein